MPMIPKRASLFIVKLFSFGNSPLGRKLRKVLPSAFLNFAAAGKLYSFCEGI